MTLKTAAFLALIGTVLVAVLDVLNLIFDLLNVLRGLVPAVSVISSLICALGALSVAVFFYLFHKAQA